MMKILVHWLKQYILSILYVTFCIIFSITICIFVKENKEIEETVTTSIQGESAPIQPQTTEVPVQMEVVETTGDVQTAYDNFFSDAVFVGDSVMYGFEKYVTKKENGFLGDPKFLTIGNFALRLNLEPITQQSTHPIYKGTKCTIEEGISMIGAQKAFLFFGLNDIAISGVDTAVDNYYKCIQKIREYSPNIQIYIISATYLLKGSEKTVLNNENIRLFNDKVKENCASWGVGYIDIASSLMDDSGCLATQYCSDGYVHQNEEAYDVWVTILRNFASEKSK